MNRLVVMLACAAPAVCFATAAATAERPRQISGVYPHLSTYAHHDPQGVYRTGSECGIGAVVPWAGRLWMINYAAHMPKGSDHKLYSIGPDLKMTVHPESVGGTPAGRMIHRESNQLLIGAYLIDAAGKVRVIPPKVMPGRITAIARHLSDPAHKVYYYMMEGELWEADVRTLEVKLLFQDPLPGWHGKGGYTSQGRLVVSNNGAGAEKRAHWQVKDLEHAPGDPKAGCLAEWDGETWRLVERYQFTDVTGPGGLRGAPDDQSPLWAIGWDKRSLRLKLLDGGKWHTYRLPKATHNNDPAHGWFTEWPRIREVGGGRALMDMHGMFFDFPLGFRRGQTAGIRPIGSHLRYIPDFCDWNGRLVLATDETSIQGNPLGGQPQSNLWFGTLADLAQWGPRSAYGGVWVNDAVEANAPSEPFHIAGYPRRVLHVVHGHGAPGAPQGVTGGLKRTADQYPLTQLSKPLIGLPRVAVPRGAFNEPGAGYRFTLDKPATVYLLVDARAVPDLPGWARTDLTATWGRYRDVVFKKSFDAGAVDIPAQTARVTDENYGVPHAALIDGAGVKITPGAGAHLAAPPAAESKPEAQAESIRLVLEIDRAGDGQWAEYQTLDAPANQLTTLHLPADLDAQWIRLTPRQASSRLTAYFHFTESVYRDGARHAALFEGLADIADTGPVHAALVRPSPTRYDLNVITRTVEGDSAGAERFVDLDTSMQFKPGAEDGALRKLLTKPTLEFEVDDASVIVRHRGVNYRLPKGDPAFDRFGSATFARVAREVESERELANIHGTFYELPLIKVGSPPLVDKLRPVASHRKRIYDFMTWRGLLLLSGVRAGAPAGEHILKAQDGSAALWAGAIDDLWKLGKPVGRGGPWKDTPVQADQPSDPYLMTGYDRKTLELTADRDVSVTLEVDVDHQSGWHACKTIRLSAGEKHTHVFPEGFSAHWIRFKTDADCTATVTLIYE